MVKRRNRIPCQPLRQAKPKNDINFGELLRIGFETAGGIALLVQNKRIDDGAAKVSALQQNLADEQGKTLALGFKNSSLQSSIASLKSDKARLEAEVAELRRQAAQEAETRRAHDTFTDAKIRGLEKTLYQSRLRNAQMSRMLEQQGRPGDAGPVSG